MHLTGSNDVIQLWVLSPAGKMDVVTVNSMWLVAEESGIFYGQCASTAAPHANMRLRVTLCR